MCALFFVGLKSIYTIFWQKTDGFRCFSIGFGHQVSCVLCVRFCFLICIDCDFKPLPRDCYEIPNSYKNILRLCLSNKHEKMKKMQKNKGRILFYRLRQLNKFIKKCQHRVRLSSMNPHRMLLITVCQIKKYCLFSLPIFCPYFLYIARFQVNFTLLIFCRQVSLLVFRSNNFYLKDIL